MTRNRLFTRRARRPWWMGRPLSAYTYFSIFVLSILGWAIYELWELIS